MSNKGAPYDKKGESEEKYRNRILDDKLNDSRLDDVDPGDEHAGDPDKDKKQSENKRDEGVEKMPHQ